MQPERFYGAEQNQGAAITAPFVLDPIPDTGLADHIRSWNVTSTAEKSHRERPRIHGSNAQTLPWTLGHLAGSSKSSAWEARISVRDVVPTAL